MITQLWEFAEDVYQSYDPDQAEGTRLDMLGKLRLMRRGLNETETAFRQAITNQGQARVDVQDIVRALRSIAGVTYAQVFVNDGQDAEDFELPAGFICAAVIGGSDEDLALALRQFVVPGISTFGNTYVSTLVDGFCRNMTILRPIQIPIDLTVTIRTRNDSTGCPPPSPFSIRNILVSALNESFVNGWDVTHYRVRQAIERQFNNVEVLSIAASRDGLPPADLATLGFIEIATFSVDNTTLVTV